MTFEIILLAVASTIRPTSLAAVYAILSSERPRQILVIYNVSGLAFTVGFGLLIVWAFNGVSLGSGGGQTEATAEIICGLLLLAFALATRVGLIGGPRSEDAPRPGGRWGQLLERRLTARTAAVAGPLTHLPGLFYLVALNAIVTHQAGDLVGLVEVLIYNAIWFTIPIGALGLCIFAPELARDKVGRINNWARSNTQRILIVVSFVAGMALVARGILGS
ncbi:MAG: GAP family protein [Solirubrobacterales bacterium]